MSEYASIDPVLQDWAAAHKFKWSTEDRGYEIRSLLWPLGGYESVQLWIDVPTDEVVIHVAHNRSKNRPSRYPIAWERKCALSDLKQCLDEALNVALMWEKGLTSA